MDLYRGKLSLRRLFVLIRHLPHDDILMRVLDYEAEQAKTRALQQRLRERRDHYAKGHP